VTTLPDAHYLVLASRLVPDRDGGFTVATLTRAALIAAGGGRPLLVTLDPATPEEHAAHRREFVRRGDAASVDDFRNLFDDAVADPSWLRAAADPGEAPQGGASRDIVDGRGRVVVSIPVIAGDPDWHLTDASVAVPGAGVVRGFRGLYRAWLAHLVARLREADAAEGMPRRPVVVVCESRQLGELLSDWDDPDVRIVHTIHNSHLEPPYDDPAGPIGSLWRRWFAVADRFDAILWPTRQQRDEVEERFGENGTSFVVPNPVAPVAEPVGAAGRDALRAVMVNRLAPQKRVDRAIAAWPAVRARVPGARLDIYGDGPLRDELAAQVAELGLSDAVRLHGHAPDVAAELDSAALLVSSTAYEGQGLSIAEALAHGCPVVSFDVRYGPRDMLAAGGGILIPRGDVAALSDAVAEVLTDGALRGRLSAEAPVAARALAPEVVAEAFAAAIRFAVERPSRRSSTVAER
jgi:poly(glycerol-phosphate) alpha-glucosyltransferase